ncbi:MAG TPA: amidohydrolase [Thermoplasmata archaeon]|nr:amidohydrolase [Thermoplasmata archaeon]
MSDAVLFRGGRIFTGRRRTEALLIDDGHVIAAGPLAELERQTPVGAERIDLEGGSVVPGLADAHLHVGEIARERAGVDLGGVRSLGALQEAIARYGAAHERGAIVGRGLDLERLAERRWPTLAELDAPARGRPVVLFHASGHAAAVNGAALERALDPRALSSRRSPEPSVLLEEEQAAVRPLVDEALPLTAEALATTLTELARLGLTCVGTMNTHPPELTLLEELAAADRLPVRVRAYPPLLPATGENATRRPAQVGRLAVVGAKGFLDGAFGPRTASLSEPYEDARSERGLDRGADAEVRAAIVDAGNRGLASALHAIGDRAVARAVELLAGAPGTPAPPRIEHASLTPPSTLARLGTQRPHLVVQPGFVLSDHWLGARLGPERRRWAYAFRTLADLGVPLAGSSDAPYDPADPWRGLAAAVSRRDDLGRSANPSPDEALSLREAWALYTTGAYAALGLPDGGRLEPGAPADLLVLGVPRWEEAVRLGASSVRQTWVAGRPMLEPPVPTEGRR